jgi:hypothetical protein
MGHYAKVEDGVVTEVIVADAELVSSLPDSDSWVKTSYNTRGGVHYVPDPETGVMDTPSADQSKALRKNFAGIGYSYDSGRDAFIPPKPFASWTLNESTCQWEPPIARPDSVDGYWWLWNEDGQNWEQKPIELSS